jgi:hypothetical protein
MPVLRFPLEAVPVLRSFPCNDLRSSVFAHLRFPRCLCGEFPCFPPSSSTGGRCLCRGSGCPVFCLLSSVFCLLSSVFCPQPSSMNHQRSVFHFPCVSLPPVVTPPPSAFCLLPSCFCLPPSAFCLLPSALCFLPSAFWLPPSAFCLLSSTIIHDPLTIRLPLSVRFRAFRG